MSILLFGRKAAEPPPTQRGRRGVLVRLREGVKANEPKHDLAWWQAKLAELWEVER